MNVQERFMDKVMPVTMGGGCWIWEGNLDGVGYGMDKYEGRIQGTHRISWQLFRGPIPEGLCVLHHCDVRCCVNPNHLFVGTKKDNARDAERKGRVPRPLAEKCVNGHNDWRLGLTRRYCATCKQETNRRIRNNPEWRAKHALQEAVRRLKRKKVSVYDYHS